MKSFDDLPRRSTSHEIAETAEIAFINAIKTAKLFVDQGADKSDYGTDFQLEAKGNGAMTNLRVHVQVKGTTAPANADGSVSIQVDRTNLNYLLSQPESIYICFHVPTQRLLTRFADDVLREYEHREGDWTQQDQITIRLFRVFDDAFQKTLQSRVLAVGRTNRDRRLEWSAAPPEQFPAVVENDIPLVEVPTNQEDAIESLRTMFKAGQDRVISNSFSRFEAVLGQLPGGMDYAYLAEINLGMNRRTFNRERVRHGISVLHEALQRGDVHPGSLLYCKGNAWLVLKDFEKARDLFNDALLQLDEPSLRGIAAQCSKNLGSALEALGHHDAATALYRRALDLDPDLGEAHFALAMWYHKKGKNPKEALHHFDAIAQRRGSALQIDAVQGWRIEILFELGEFEAAFREIQNLAVESSAEAWIWPWCAFLVSRYGRTNVATTRKAVAFWRRYTMVFPRDVRGERERLFCLCSLKMQGEDSGITFGEFEEAVLKQIGHGDTNVAMLWDRLGHWAQADNNWVIAEKYFRKAHDIDPEQFGYCLGTALNFLRRHAEALPILLSQATEAKGDAMSWFQVAVAREGVCDIAGAKEAYTRAIELDHNYDLAWFNLGGILWNHDETVSALATWQEAIRRFPDHHLAAELRKKFPTPFDNR